MGTPNDYAPPPPPPPPNEYVPQPPPPPPATAPPLPVTGVPMIPMGATPYMHYAPSANPVIQMPQPQGDGDWSTGLCGCTEDIGNCCMTFWCPCVTFGQIAEIIDRGSPSCGASGALYALVAVLTGCQCIYSCFYRSKLRAQYILPESPCPDFLVHWCCEACALCQAYRELKNRGYDMALGWHGNMVRQQSYGVNQPPPVQGGMIR